VVSDYAEFGGLPREFALAVALGNDEEGEFAALVSERLAGGRAALAEMGRSARAYVARNHAPERAAAELVAALEELERFRPPGDEAPRVPRKSSLTSSLPAGEFRLPSLDDWQRGERRRLALEIVNAGDDVWLPSREQPGGVVFGVELRIGDRDEWAGRPWLELETPLEPGASRTFELAMRRPLAPALLVIKPLVADGSGLQPFGAWRFEQWL
jgi:hypothetical protein